MTSREKALSSIREAAVAAHPEKYWERYIAPGTVADAPVCLNDVLLAIEKSNDPQYAVYSTGEFMKWGDTPTGIKWNLRKTLEDQEDATLFFLAGLLSKE